MASRSLRFLRPSLYFEVEPSAKAVPRVCVRPPHHACRRAASTSTVNGRSENSELHKRISELRASGLESYPRVRRAESDLTCQAFHQQYSSLQPGQSAENETVTVRGRVRSSRIAGNKLVFLDVVQNEERVQGLCNLRLLEESGVNQEAFQTFYRIARRGDIFSLTGIPHRTPRGELSVQVTKLPELLAPSIHQLPTELTDAAVRMRNRHTDLLVNRRTADTLRMRSYIIQALREHLLHEDFLEVETPILADRAGGAVARPFVTSATEFSEKKLALRIAPELWLKRLAIGGFDRVFEIGPSFRNEGLDKTHNPEFTTCEFYQAFADIEDLIRMSEALLRHLSERVTHLRQTKLTSIPELDFEVPSASFNRIDFIPALEAAIARPLPPLSEQSAVAGVIEIFKSLEITLPESPTLPRLLDRLSTIYLEPQCTAPTFITNLPECLAPLSKSYPHPDLANQRVSARVELFIHGREILNAYEEENSPFEQRRKFQAQQADSLRDGNAAAETTVDESYLEALEWGLPPTGGWGCGIDRLVMLFTGASKIGDVLSFGNLRNVVALGTARPTKGASKKEEAEAEGGSSARG